jgi:hypothetical protein
MEDVRSREMITIFCGHGNGASVLAGALYELGADLGPEPSDLSLAPGGPHGHFEHAPVLNLDRDVLIALGGTWSTPPALPRDWVEDERIAPRRQRAEQVARETPDRMIVEDPRLSLVQPLWEEVGDVPATILCLRDPGTTAERLKAKHELTMDQGLFLWFRYNAAAVLNRPDALVVEFEALVTQPDTQLARIADHLDLRVDSKIFEATTRTLSLMHTDLATNDLGDTPIGVVCGRLHDLVRSGENLESDEMVWTLASLVTELPWAGPSDPDIIRARREVRELGSQVRRLSRENKFGRQRLRRLEAELRQAHSKVDELTIAQTRVLLDAMQGGRR